MIHKIKVIKNGKKFIYTYDNSDSSVRDENGTLLLPQNRGLVEYKKVPWFSPTKNNAVKTVDDLMEICLGTRCNFHCEYCSQQRVRGLAYDAKPKDVPIFIDKLKQSGIKPNRVQLWGGEPLVYWKTIKVLVPELRRVLPNTQLSCLTNGSLLTRDKVDFYKDYEMALFISHDGCGNQARYNDVLDDPVVVDAIKYAKQVIKNPRSFAFGATPSKGNTDCEKIITFFRNKLGDDYGVATHNIARCHDSLDKKQVDSCTFSKEDLQEYSDSVYRVLHNQNANDYSLFVRAEFLEESILFGKPIDAVPTECSMPTNMGIVVDLRGKILPCHNHPNKDITLGDITDLRNVKALGYHFWKARKRCRDCLVVHSCKGGCPGADPEANRLSCPNLYALHYGIFRAVIERLFGVYMEGVV